MGSGGGGGGIEPNISTDLAFINLRLSLQSLVNNNKTIPTKMSSVNLSFQDAGIHITNVMEFSATIELSAPKDLAKLYNFVSEKYTNIIIVTSFCYHGHSRPVSSQTFPEMISTSSSAEEFSRREEACWRI